MATASSWGGNEAGDKLCTEEQESHIGHSSWGQPMRDDDALSTEMVECKCRGAGGGLFQCAISGWGDAVLAVRSGLMDQVPKTRR